MKKKGKTIYVMTNILRDFLEIPYDQLEELNLEIKAQRTARVSPDQMREERMRYLSDERRIKAVTVCFTDLEGRLHMLDYDKKFLLKAADALTFDGSSVRGFTVQSESDLRLAIDWSAFYWLPADVFGPGKVLLFGVVQARDGTPYPSDMRTKLQTYINELYEHKGLTCNVASEAEGILLQGRNAEQRYYETGEFTFVSTSGYYHSLPEDPLRHFIDTAAEVQRAMGFGNEKDHPEVAPAQFELNYSYTEATIAADQILLYKLICRQIASRLNMTATFLPKPVTGVNGNGMHTNLSIASSSGNLFHDPNGHADLSDYGWDFVERILHAAPELCLVLNASVNAYRRLDPNFEAPNQIKASPIGRNSMIRIPIGNARSARIEVRSIAPDANPYMLIYTLLKTGLEGERPAASLRDGTAILPDNIYDAIQSFRTGKAMANILGEEAHTKFADLKTMVADRCPRQLGNKIKRAEVQFHHEVTNQYLWSRF
jgi:glutamine synthetase